MSHSQSKTWSLAQLPVSLNLPSMTRLDKRTCTVVPGRTQHSNLRRLSLYLETSSPCKQMTLIWLRRRTRWRSLHNSPTIHLSPRSSRSQCASVETAMQRTYWQYRPLPSQTWSTPLVTHLWLRLGRLMKTSLPWTPTSTAELTRSSGGWIIKMIKMSILMWTTLLELSQLRRVTPQMLDNIRFSIV